MKGIRGLLEKDFRLFFSARWQSFLCVSVCGVIFYADGKEDSYFYCNLYPICYSSICGEYN